MIKRIRDIEQYLDRENPRVIGVAAAEDQDIMELVKYLELRRIARFVLAGDGGKITELLEENGISEGTAKVVNCQDHSEAARTVVSLARSGECDLIMKGNLHTSVFLKAVLDKENGLNTGKLLSQITVYDKPDEAGIQLMTDCAMAIEPGLEDKKAIIENAVELMRRLGYDCPRVALISALEVVNPKIPDTMEAAILSKMCDRGQIKNCIVDGPLALDNAVSEEAARHKNITSPVAGHADILVFPNLQVANCVFKTLIFFAKMDTAAVIMGTKAPVVMTSRTDTVENKMLSIMFSIYLSGKTDVSLS